MKILKFPVAIWEDYDGCFTAKTLDGEPVAAADVTPAGAIAQLKKYLRWRFRQVDACQYPDMNDLEQTDFEVRVRPRYTTDQSVFPCEQTVTLRVPVVIGARRDHSYVLSAPTVGTHLSCVSRPILHELGSEALQSELSGLTPAEVARNLPPKRLTLQSINVRVDDAQPRDAGAFLQNLRVVADPLGERSMRQRFGRAWGRDSEIAALAKQLTANKTNLLIVGDSGSGKTTLLANAVRQIERVKPAADEYVQTRHRFWLTSGSRLIAGMQYLGQWEERCESVIEELSDIGGVLCVENLLDLVRSGSGKPTSSVAAFFMPYMESGELQLISEATPFELDACRKLLPNFAELLQIQTLRSFTPQESKTVLSQVVGDAARNARVKFDEKLPARTYHLFRRFMPYQPFPGKATHFVKSLLEANEDGRVGIADADDSFRQLTGLPDVLLKDELSLTQESVCGALEAHILGQTAACQAAAAVVTRFKAGLNDPARPLGVLMFCGPTGVGKTELAKTLASYLFGAGGSADNSRLIRLDMSEYSGFDAAERLLMRADGRPSALIEQMRIQPFAVVLLDEIEKASSQVFDVLLGLLDEGRLTDRFGRTTEFRSAVIIMTSNLGVSQREPVGFGSSAPPYEREVFNAFRPEFFNRIDSVVSFQPLARRTIIDITRKELGAISQREGVRKLGVRLHYSQSLVDHLAAAGFDAQLGARPLQRTVEQLVVAPLARFLVTNQPASTQEILLDLSDSEVVVSAATSAKSPGG